MKIGNRKNCEYTNIYCGKWGKNSIQRRAYKGKQKKDEMRVRLVAVYNDEDEKHHIYITNIQKDVLNVKDIAKLAEEFIHS